MLTETETQQTINGITIIDRTISVVTTKGVPVLEYYILKIIGKDQNGKPRGISYYTYNEDRHKEKKKDWVKKISGETYIKRISRPFNVLAV